MEAMGQTPVPLDQLTKTTVSEDFLGTTWSSVGAGWIEPDCIDTYVPEEGVTVTVEKGYGPEKTIGGGYPGLLFRLSGTLPDFELLGGPPV